MKIRDLSYICWQVCAIVSVYYFIFTEDNMDEIYMGILSLINYAYYKQ